MLQCSVHEGESLRQEFLNMNMKINEQPNLVFVGTNKLE